MDLSTIKKAHELIKPYIKKTPLIRCYELEQLLQSQSRIFLKCENLQIMNSFKPRGAFNALLHLNEEQKRKGVVTRSSGNFAIALAYAGHLLGIPTTIIMPKNVTRVKYDRTAALHAAILLAYTRAEEDDLVLKLGQGKGLAMLSPYNHLDVIAGQGTIGLELMEQLPNIKHIFCPISGGGLMGGISAALKQINSTIQTIGVEPEGANDYFLSRQKKTKVRLQHIDTIADGLRAPTVGDLTYPILEKYVDEVAIVSDDAIKNAMKFLYEKVGMIIEPSGAASVAAFIQNKSDLNGDIVCILSGGNVDLEKFYEYIAND